MMNFIIGIFSVYSFANQPILGIQKCKEMENVYHQTLYLILRIALAMLRTAARNISQI